MIRLGITGTDTQVGKTLVACALAGALTRRGLRVAAMKPIETGVSFDDVNRDGARLARAAGGRNPLVSLAPLTFSEPVSPLLAAEREGSKVNVALLDAAVERAARDCDVLLIEGAGGLLVPIAEGVSFDTLFARWRLGILIVAPNRLGVINHTRLTIRAARAAGLAVRAVVLNQVGQDGSDRSITDNGRLIAELEKVHVVQLPRAEQVDDLDMVADLAERSGLAGLIAPDVVSPPV